ncbi:MAG: stage III sporulation AC/AD family protein [Clostridia bacterium]|nr:stage III sporulation AC/AD family protein [Clostridia bacterium]
MDSFEMMMRACGVGVVAALCLVVIGRASGGYGFALRIGGAVLLFGVFLIIFGESVEDLRTALAAISGSDFVADSFGVMLKGLGVALLGRFCADICRDCGEHTLATGVESVGRIVIFSLSLPMLGDILTLAGELLGISR